MPSRTIFGGSVRDRETGENLTETERTFQAEDAVVRLGGVPVSYFPYLGGGANDPFGPLSAIGFRQDRIFGTQFYTTWDVLELIGVRRLPGEHWGLLLDYLSQRGPAIGTNYMETVGDEFFQYEQS